MHNFYLKVTQEDRDFIDAIFTRAIIQYPTKLDSTNNCEVAVEAVAKWIYESGLNTGKYPVSA